MTLQIPMNKPKLWHCYNSRSLRVLWAMEELGIDYDLEVMPFPPRYMVPDYKTLNSLGTVPYFIDGDTHMTESVAICQYLGDKYLLHNTALRLTLAFSELEYGNYLNWLLHSDATLTFPQTLVLRYREFPVKGGQQVQVADDYDAWFAARLVRLNEHLINRKYLCANRFTMADIAIGFALHLATLLKLEHHFSPQIIDYLTHLRQRPAFIRAQTIGIELDPFVRQ